MSPELPGQMAPGALPRRDGTDPGGSAAAECAPRPRPRTAREPNARAGTAGTDNGERPKARPDAPAADLVGAPPLQPAPEGARNVKAPCGARARRTAPCDAAADTVGDGGGTLGDDGAPRYLAMAVSTSAPALRAPVAACGTTLPALLAQSRAECARRCGSNGFCDPSSAHGCGGEYCRGALDLV